MSSSTVSRVLNHDDTLSVSIETKRKIFEAAEELSYQKPQKSHKKSQNKYSFALVHWYNELQELNDPYFLSIRIGIEHECTFNDISLTKIYYTNNEYIFPDKSYDAIILVGKFSSKQHKFFKNYSNNIILVHDTSYNFEFDCVVAEFKQITSDIVDNILQRGHTRIGYIGGTEKIVDSQQLITDTRQVEFTTYLKSVNLFQEQFIRIGNFSFSDGYNMMLDIINNCDTLPTCIFIASDTLATGALRALTENQINVPEQVSIISCNDIPTARYLSPSLTTVKIHTEFMGRQSVKLALEHILEPRSEKVKLIVPHKIIFRESF